MSFAGVPLKSLPLKKRVVQKKLRVDRDILQIADRMHEAVLSSAEFLLRKSILLWRAYDEENASEECAEFIAMAKEKFQKLQNAHVREVMLRTLLTA